jgi:hypothetical protein
LGSGSEFWPVEGRCGYGAVIRRGLRLRLWLSLLKRRVPNVASLALAQTVHDRRVKPGGLADVVELASHSLGGGGFVAAAPQGPGEHTAGGAGRRVLVFVAGCLGVDTGQVVVSSAGHAHVEVFAASGTVDDEHAIIDGDALGFVDGERNAKLVLGVVLRRDAFGIRLFQRNRPPWQGSADR